MCSSDLSSKGNEYFCEVDEDFILDRFNLTGLNNEVANYAQALDLITDNLDDDIQDELRGSLDVQARLLYGLIHARWIVTQRGLQKMLDKYKRADFGRCPRVLCTSQPLLPLGLTDLPYEKSVKLFCARCEDIYSPKSTRHGSIDGAYFGTTFAHLMGIVWGSLGCVPKGGGGDVMGNVVRVVEMARVGRERERERERVGAERERERVGAAEQAGGAGGEASAPRAGRRRRAEASGDSQADQTGATGANGAGNGGGAAASREVQVQVPTSAAATDALLNAGLEGFSTAGAALGAERYRPKIYGFQLHETARLQRWQEAMRDRQIGRLEKFEVGSRG